MTPIQYARQKGLTFSLKKDYFSYSRDLVVKIIGELDDTDNSNVVVLQVVDTNIEFQVPEKELVSLIDLPEYYLTFCPMEGEKKIWLSVDLFSGGVYGEFTVEFLGKSDGFKIVAFDDAFFALKKFLPFIEQAKSSNYYEFIENLKKLEIIEAKV